MSASASQAHQFYRHVAKSRELWTVRKADIFAKAQLQSGRFSTPFWSSKPRVEKIISKFPFYAGSEPVLVSYQEFLEVWVKNIKAENGLIGVNWSGPKLTGFNIEPDFVVRAIEICISTA